MIKWAWKAMLDTICADGEKPSGAVDVEAIQQGKDPKERTSNTGPMRRCMCHCVVKRVEDGPKLSISEAGLLVGANADRSISFTAATGTFSAVRAIFLSRMVVSLVGERRQVVNSQTAEI